VYCTLCIYDLPCHVAGQRPKIDFDRKWISEINQPDTDQQQLHTNLWLNRTLYTPKHHRTTTVYLPKKVVVGRGLKGRQFPAASSQFQYLASQKPKKTLPQASPPAPKPTRHRQRHYHYSSRSQQVAGTQPCGSGGWARRGRVTRWARNIQTRASLSWGCLAWPARQFVQFAIDAWSWYLPIGQFRHSVTLSGCVYLPLGQGRHPQFAYLATSCMRAALESALFLCLQLPRSQAAAGSVACLGVLDVLDAVVFLAPAGLPH
jgi:hypothetical protein